MKTSIKLLNLGILILLALGIFAQAPNSFNYQAVLRDAQGKVKANTETSIVISLIQGSADGSEIFSETQTVTTNAFGLINLEIGIVNTTDFAAINWVEGPYFIKIAVDGTEMGTSQLLSVPYALHAKTVENEQQTLILDGSILTLSGGGGSVTIPTGASADNWGSQTVVTDASLSGNGTTATPLKIGQNAATSGQVLKWDGTNWTPANDRLSLPYVDTLKTNETAFSIFTTGTLGSAIMGRALSESGATEGVKGVTYSNLGYGVWGIAYSPTGSTRGVYGKSSSSTGRGVYGEAESSSGVNYGVSGFSNSTDGYGIYGTAPTYGVYGRAELATDSTYGVYGKNNGTLGTNYGVYGEAESNNGRGVYGKANSVTGGTCGVKGYSKSSTGYGVYGLAAKYGVYGFADSVGITTYGVTGKSASETGYGVYGSATSTTGINYGVRGRSSSSSGYGVHGIAPTTGVIGEATSSTGVAYGVYGQTASSAGYGVYGSGINVGTTGLASGKEGIGVSGIAGNIDGTGVLGQAVYTGGVGVYGIGNNYDFYAGGSGTNYGPFTGAHEVKLCEGFPATCETGLIVTATGKTFFRKDESGKISISSTLPEVALSIKANDKAVFGVIVKESPLIKNHWFKESGRFAIVNALGEGRVWVCNASGNIEAGDYITTSDAPGYGQKQNDDLLHNYTVGKATETVDWDKVTTTITVNGKTFKVYLIAVVYTCG